jgi:YVTN family beta-propeller protein
VDGYGTSSVIRVDPARMKVTRTIRMRDQIWDVTYGAGSVWATEPNLGYVDRINPKTNKVGRRIHIPHSGPANLRYGGGAVWVGSLSGRKVFRIDARTNRVTSVRVGETPRSVAVTSSAIWVSNNGSNTVSRIDAKTRRVVATIRVGQNPENAAAAPDGTVFVPNVGDDSVSRIDPATNKVIQTIPVGIKPFPAASAFGDIWVPSAGGTEVYRLHVS